MASLGLTLDRTAVGDRYVIERMREKGFNVGGEQSGHIILSDYSTTGDGLVAALQVLAVVHKAGKPVSEVCRRFEPVPQVLRNVRFNGGKPLEHPAVTKAIADATARLGDRGRLVIRPSGTEPVIRVMGEADDKALVDSAGQRRLRRGRGRGIERVAFEWSRLGSFFVGVPGLDRGDPVWVFLASGVFTPKVPFERVAFSWIGLDSLGDYALD